MNQHKCSVLFQAILPLLNKICWPVKEWRFSLVHALGAFFCVVRHVLLRNSVASASSILRTAHITLHLPSILPRLLHTSIPTMLLLLGAALLCSVGLVATQTTDPQLTGTWSTKSNSTFTGPVRFTCLFLPDVSINSNMCTGFLRPRQREDVRASTYRHLVLLYR